MLKMSFYTDAISTILSYTGAYIVCTFSAIILKSLVHNTCMKSVLVMYMYNCQFHHDKSVNIFTILNSGF